MSLLKTCKWVQAACFVIIKGVWGLLINLSKVCEACSEEFCHGACVLFDYNHQVSFATIFEPCVRNICHNIWTSCGIKKIDSLPPAQSFVWLYGFSGKPPVFLQIKILTSSEFSREERPERGTHPRSRERRTEKNAKDPQSFVRRIWNEILKKKKNHPIWLP